MIRFSKNYVLKNSAGLYKSAAQIHMTIQEFLVFIPQANLKIVYNLF